MEIINVNDILLDKNMKLYLLNTYQNYQHHYQMKFKKLPDQLDKSFSTDMRTDSQKGKFEYYHNKLIEIMKEKNYDIQQAFLSDDISPISVKKRMAKDYPVYEVIDGRHRCLIAIQNGIQNIKVNIINFSP